SGQLKLVLGNAEENLHDPEFQRDMLLTVRASAARIDTLIARLRQPEDEAAKDSSVRGPLQSLRGIAKARRREVQVEGEAGIDDVTMPPEAFEAAVTHLLNNAEEASPAGEPVRLRLYRIEGHPVLDITDRGPGMTPDFIRDELFRPLSTSKPNGSGIGAWQARELLRRSGGDLLVIARPGAGTTMRLLLPTQGATTPLPVLTQDAVA
ncbi:MAG TPA: ATP-binding protein, partial [Roseomonas sp.]